MNWIDPISEPEISWSNHSWSSAIDIKPVQARAIREWLKQSNNPLHISFRDTTWQKRLRKEQP